jgi:hypothetical protein
MKIIVLLFVMNISLIIYGQDFLRDSLLTSRIDEMYLDTVPLDTLWCINSGYECPLDTIFGIVYYTEEGQDAVILQDYGYYVDYCGGISSLGMVNGEKVNFSNCFMPRSFIRSGYTDEITGKKYGEYYQNQDGTFYDSEFREIPIRYVYGLLIIEKP